LQPDELGVARVREVGQHLRGLVFRVALHRPLLPRHLVRSSLWSTRTIRRWSLHRSRYFAIVISSFIPFIWKAPSPTSAKTGRSGCANFAAIAYGTPGPIVASVPESDAIIPFRILMSRAYQLAAEPESAARM